MSEPSRGAFNIVPGLVDYHASQAEMLLLQYENINRLLGETQDWTHPGTFCEVLLRNAIRRFLPARYGVDKGYIYGRAPIEDGNETHCPEIDILVHDKHAFAPVFQMDDFVIVQPEAIRAVIQVKRTLDTAKTKEGIENVVLAKLFFARIMRVTNKPFGNYPSRFFSAVVGFVEEGNFSKPYYERILVDWRNRTRPYDDARRPLISMFVLPNFIGALNGSFLLSEYLHENRRYDLYPSFHVTETIQNQKPLQVRKNMALQALLVNLTSFIQGLDILPPVDFPHDFSSIDSIHISPDGP